MPSDVTALIRTYDSARTLSRCLDSLRRQTCMPREVVVVDSGSTDGTLEIAKSHDAKIVHYPADEPFHYSRSLNLGVGRVTSKHTLIISSHVSLPDLQTVEVLRDLLTEDTSRCAASIRGASSTPEEACIGNIKWNLVTRANFVSRFGGIGISNSCNLIPTELWKRHPFDENIPRCEDQKWLLHYLSQGWTAARVQRPQIVYDNPYYNDTKEVQDIITMAEHDINPTLTEWSSLSTRTRNALSALRRANWRRFTYQMRVLFGLLLVKSGASTDIESKYF